MQHLTKNTLRWIAVFPGALIASIIALFPLHWLLYLKFADNGTILGFIELPQGTNISIEYVISPFVIAITFILIGSKIAPKFKFKTAIILAILYLLFAIGTIIFSIKNGIEISFGARTAGSLFGLFAGLFIIWKLEKTRCLKNE